MSARAKRTPRIEITARALRGTPFAIFFLIAASFLVGILYNPIIAANFQGDDYGFLRYLFFNYPALLQGQGLYEWLVSFPWLSFLPYFRPVLQLFNLLDYTAWGLNPFGYHLTNLLLHWLTSFFVFVFCNQLTRSRLAAVAAGLFFAMMPIHVEAVSWFAARADGLNALWYVMSVVFFVLYRQRERRLFLAVSVVAFAMALGVKEVAVTIPIIIIAYDLLYHRDSQSVHRPRAWLVPYALFALTLAGYAALRLITRGVAGSGSFELARTFEWDYLLQLYALGITDPFLSDMTGELRSIIFGIVIGLMIIYRAHRQLLLGVFWAIVTLVPSLLSINATIFDRYLYLPSIGFALVIGSILSQPIPQPWRWSRVIGIGLVGTLGIFYASALYARNQEWGRAAQITQTVEEQVQALHPKFPADARLVFVNVPVLVGGRQMQAFGNMLPSAMQIQYDNPNLEILKPPAFPILSDRLDRTFFFAYDRRKITERLDLVRALEQRNRCANFKPAIVWNFSQDAQGWETWNELSQFENRDGMLTTRALGSDPYMASPEISISTLGLGDIQVEMRVRAEKLVRGAWYWLVAGQLDFSPELEEEFPVRADGEFRTYRVDLAQHGRLFVGDQIIRLRFDPTDAVADIAIKSISISTRCSNLQGDQCICNP